MLSRLYVNNYRCLVDFEFKPKQVQLLLGVNGSGKSSVFDVLDALRRIVVDGEPLRGLFGGITRTRWSTTWEQQFEIEFQSDHASYRYSLAINKGPRVSAEKLAHDGKLVFHAEGGKLIQVDGKEQADSLGRRVRDDRSALSGIDTPSAGSFRKLMEAITPVQINPWAMKSSSAREASRPTRDLANLGDWFRHLAQQDPAAAVETFVKLQEVIPGLRSLNALEAGPETRMVHAEFDGPRGNFKLPLHRLSEGQRALIGLYLLICNLDPGATLLVDEPENFLALAEIQPWIIEAGDRVEEVGGQLILASHHPEIINRLAHEAIILERDEAGRTSLLPWRTDNSGLRPAEIVARGWESA